MKHLLIALALALLSTPLHAQDVSGTATVTLEWQAPTHKIDGTPLEDLSGFVVFWGDAARDAEGCTAPSSLDDDACYAHAFDVADPDAASEGLTVTLDGPTELYFAMVAYRANGMISNYSNEVSRVIELEIDTPPEAPTLQDVQMQISCEHADDRVSCTFSVQ